MAGVIGAIGLVAALVVWHPIHSTTLILREGGGRVTGELRAFVDDFPPGPDGRAIERYLPGRLRIVAGTGVPLAWRYQSHRVEAGVLVVDLLLETSTVRGAILTDRLLEEKFADQVNVVAVERGGRRNTVVFLARQGPQPLP